MKNVFFLCGISICIFTVFLLFRNQQIFGGVAFIKQFQSGIASTTGATAYTIDWSTKKLQRIILQANNVSIAINATSSTPLDGERYILEVCQQDPAYTGAFFSTPGQLRWAETTTTITTTVNTCHWILFLYELRTSTYKVLASTTVVMY